MTPAREDPSFAPSFAAARVVAAVAAAVAVARLPYGYYELLRWLVCAVAAFTAWRASELRRSGWAWVFIVLALVFNPVVPVRLRRETWAWADIAAAVLLLVSLATIRPRSEGQVGGRTP